MNKPRDIGPEFYEFHKMISAKYNKFFIPLFSGSDTAMLLFTRVNSLIFLGAVTILVLLLFPQNVLSKNTVVYASLTILCGLTLLIFTQKHPFIATALPLGILVVSLTIHELTTWTYYRSITVSIVGWTIGYLIPICFSHSKNDEMLWQKTMPPVRQQKQKLVSKYL